MFVHLAGSLTYGAIANGMRTRRVVERLRRWGAGPAEQDRHASGVLDCDDGKASDSGGSGRHDNPTSPSLDTRVLTP